MRKSRFISGEFRPIDVGHLVLGRWGILAARLLGFGCLAAYLTAVGDWRISIPYVLAFPVVLMFVAWLLVSLGVHERYPKLRQYLLFPKAQETTEAPVSEDQWDLRKLTYAQRGLPGYFFLLTPAEDGLICVPLLLIGITPLSALIAGVAFGALHLARDNYFECAVKGMGYALAYYFILPHGLLTIVAGHMLMNSIGFGAMEVRKRVLTKRIQSSRPPESAGSRTGAGTDQA